MMEIKTPDNENAYPNSPPEIKFNSKINLPCVNQSNGQVDKSKFNMFKNWQKKYTLEDCLLGLKQEMINNKKLNQPQDGDMFWARPASNCEAGLPGNE